MMELGTCDVCGEQNRYCPNESCGIITCRQVCPRCKFNFEESEMFNEKSRIIIGVEGTPIVVRLVPHQTDDKLVMVKGVGESPLTFLQALEIAPASELITGTSFTMVAAPRGMVGERFALLLTKVLEAAEPTKVKPVDGPCVECGNDDGTHFNFCPKHVSV